MENPFDLIDLENTIHHHHLEWHYEDPSEAKATTWSVIAAHADAFSYNYDYLVHFINMKNETCGWGGDPFYYCPIPIPPKLEFLEILEFRESELRRATKDTTAEWNWPKSWGHVHWGCPIINRRAEVDGKYTLLDDSELEKKAWFDLQSTIDAIMVHKILMGHLSHAPIDISSFELQRNISLLLNIFYRTKQFRSFDQGDVRYSFKITPNIETPPFLISYDLPLLLQKQKQSSEEQTQMRWDIDELLGLYEPNAKQYKSSFSPLFSPSKQAPQIVIYERGIKYCANETGLSDSILLQIVIIHELSHWIVHKLQDNKGNIWKNDLFDSTNADVHEGWAQLLTFWALDYLRDKEGMKVFEELNKNQSPPYHKYKEILNHCNDEITILNSLPPLRTTNGGASFKDWLKLL